MRSHICNLQTYKNWSPSRHDARGLNLPERQTWYVAPAIHTRDSDCLEASNFSAALKMLGGESDDVELHSFNHWACGWFEILLVRPESDAYKILHDIEDGLANYPVLDEEDFSEREEEAAKETWANCFTSKERIDYIRNHRSQFDFRDMYELMGCVRGKFFCGYASELIG